MKNRMHILIPALVLVVAVSATVPADAGVFGGSKDKDVEHPTKWRFQRSPSMDFMKGAVTRDMYSGWEIGGVRLHLTKECRVIGRDGGRHVLREGDHVIVMGPQTGDLMAAWQIQVIDPDQLTKGANPEEMVVWSEVDSSVGEGNGPN